MIEGMITVKEYADQKGKSVQSVYKQMKSKENAVALEGHIHIRRVNNKDVKFLDEEGVKVLDEASKHSIQVILESDDKERIARLEEEKQALIIKIAQIQDELIKTQKELSAEKDSVKQLQIEKIALLEAKQEEEKKTFWQRLFG